MPTKPIERLMFAQGGRCFFCSKPLEKAQASVEHLVALTNGGKDNDENCVACCKALNNLFGRMSLKEKLIIVLNQKGQFKCPGSSMQAPAAKATASPAAAKAPRTRAEKLAPVVSDLHKRGNARPGTVEKLLNTIKSQLVQLGEPSSEAEALLHDLAAQAYVTVNEQRVSYDLPQKAD